MQLQLEKVEKAEPQSKPFPFPAIGSQITPLPSFVSHCRRLFHLFSFRFHVHSCKFERLSYNDLLNLYNYAGRLMRPMSKPVMHQHIHMHIPSAQPAMSNPPYPFSTVPRSHPKCIIHDAIGVPDIYKVGQHGRRLSSPSFFPPPSPHCGTYATLCLLPSPYFSAVRTSRTTQVRENCEPAHPIMSANGSHCQDRMQPAHGALSDERAVGESARIDSEGRVGRRARHISVRAAGGWGARPYRLARK